MTTDSHIFVTGGTGFLGSYILRHLIEKGYTRITAIKRNTSRLGLIEDIIDKINFIEADLFDYEILKEILQDVDVVFHCAAIIAFSKSEFKEMRKVNVDGTANLINAALEGSVKKFMHVSSIAALGRTSEAQIISESSEFQHTALDTGYGLTKHLAEREVWRGGSEGLDVTMINPAMIMGPGYWDTGTSKLVDTVYKRLKYYPVGSSGFVDVRDVAQIAVEMIEKEIMNTRMVCAAESVKIKHIMDTICEHLDIPKPSIKLTPILRGIAWRVEWLRAKLSGSRQLITKETLTTSASDFTFDNSLSKKVLNFSYRSVDETMKETCDVYRACLEKGAEFGVFGRSGHLT